MTLRPLTPGDPTMTTLPAQPVTAADILALAPGFTGPLWCLKNNDEGDWAGPFQTLNDIVGQAAAQWGMTREDVLENGDEPQVVVLAEDAALLTLVAALTESGVEQAKAEGFAADLRERLSATMSQDAQSYAGHVVVYDVAPDGSLTPVGA
ncbi:hypothetical protein GO986_17780 [Deinococcus sp. HMF7620]|uniref:Uncharacterized protein n=1 Tax=Deinococcus arboris TaxID=2682977 RepID=A0A7C9HTH7_9DEIO|nr:hypothetical protein [Deinococcus arboris]MVN88589.1 hypothetical protein [Deinococcus arboris]